MLHELINTWFHWVNDWGYWGVVLLMAMESSIFPVPSEVVMPPAAFLAAQGKMSLSGVILAGTFGSWAGSAITYGVSRWLGHVFIRKWGRYFFITEEKLKRAEHFAQRYEAGGIFFARLLPVVRHLISIPAGILEMRFGVFSLMTIIGSAIWCSVLAWFGQSLVDGPDATMTADYFLGQLKHKSHLVALGVLLISVLYFVMLKMTAPKEVK
ncbi:MAG: DedA family protein [Verrucomicrobiaceae bacterium]|nr:DedA family protein [Verrucomicrobiaceae bacterium]